MPEFDWDDENTTNLASLAGLYALNIINPWTPIHTPEHLHVRPPLPYPVATGGPSPLDGGLVFMCCRVDDCDVELTHMILSLN